MINESVAITASLVILAMIEFCLDIKLNGNINPTYKPSEHVRMEGKLYVGLYLKRNCVEG